MTSSHSSLHVHRRATLTAHAQHTACEQQCRVVDVRAHSSCAQKELRHMTQASSSSVSPVSRARLRVKDASMMAALRERVMRGMLCWG